MKMAMMCQVDYDKICARKGRINWICEKATTNDNKNRKNREGKVVDIKFIASTFLTSNYCSQEFILDVARLRRFGREFYVHKKRWTETETEWEIENKIKWREREREKSSKDIKPSGVEWLNWELSVEFCEEQKERERERERERETLESFCSITGNNFFGLSECVAHKSNRKRK